MNQFKRCRELSGFTQKQVAITLKISVQAVSYWESGERMPGYQTLLRLADLYRVTTDELLGRVTSSNNDQLTADERRIISEYRELNRQGQEYIRQTMYAIVNSPVYKKDANIAVMELTEEV